MGYLGGGRYGRGPRAFPASTCISIDDEVVHGIPGDRMIRAGQIVSIDAGAIYDGWHGDGARTFVVGEPTPERGGRAKRYFRITRNGLRQVRDTRGALISLWQGIPALQGETL